MRELLGLLPSNNRLLVRFSC